MVDQLRYHPTLTSIYLDIYDSNRTIMEKIAILTKPMKAVTVTSTGKMTKMRLNASIFTKNSIKPKIQLIVPEEYLCIINR